MSALAVLQHARSAGVRVEVEGGDLILEATAGDVPADLIAEARAAKPELLKLLRLWDAADWHAFYVERAGIIEHDGHTSRAEAEKRAFEHCIIEWLNQHPVPSPPGHCAACGESETPGAVVVPFGTDASGHTWLHPACWPAWHQARIANAEKALAVMGIREIE